MGKVVVKANIEVEACKPPLNPDPKSLEHKSDFENISSSFLAVQNSSIGDLVTD